jgi:hypothetical protein
MVTYGTGLPASQQSVSPRASGSMTSQVPCMLSRACTINALVLSPSHITLCFNTSIISRVPHACLFLDMTHAIHFMELDPPSVSLPIMEKISEYDMRLPLRSRTCTCRLQVTMTNVHDNTWQFFCVMECKLCHVEGAANHGFFVRCFLSSLPFTSLLTAVCTDYRLPDFLHRVVTAYFVFLQGGQRPSKLELELWGALALSWS